MKIDLISYTNEYEYTVKQILSADKLNKALFLRLFSDLHRESRIILADGRAAGIVLTGRSGSTFYCIIFVKKEMRRNGIASFALQKFEDEVSETCTELSSFFNIEDEAALQFSEKHGYRRHYDSVYMEYYGERPRETPVPVRMYREEDYEEAQSMYAEAFHRMRVAVGDFPDSKPAPQSAKGRAAWKNDAENYFLFEDGGEIVGVGHLDGFEIGSISIRVDKQRQGIGRSFMPYLMNRIFDRGYDKVALECVVGNPARKLYDELGFKPIYTERFVRKKLR